MRRELCLRIVWAVGLCVASGTTIIVADPWYRDAGAAADGSPLDVSGQGQDPEEAQGSIEILSAADNVSPAEGATDVAQDVTLTWPAGPYPGTYDVYFGTSVAEVNDATLADTKGILVGLGQTATTFDPPGSLAYGQTYYWRVDQVNVSPAGAIYKGAVRSFTVEPYAYLVKPASVIASSSQLGMGPEKTIDSSGLNANDQHGTDRAAMWLSTGVQPNWIQYQFDRAYKLYDLKVWNSNQAGEGILGFGARDVKIEYCADGIVWKTLANVPEFARAPGALGYTANTTVRFGGVMAQYVRLTIRSTWAGVGSVTGLSEVRFSHIPVQAFAPQPANGAASVNVDTSLSWRPGREAVVHNVFLGTDQTTVAGGVVPAQALTDHNLVPGALNFGTRYYWKVDEINDVTYAGAVWSFTTLDYAVVDDFESYNDTDHRLRDTWIDGRADGKSNSVIRSTGRPPAERSHPHGGQQDLALEYNNVDPPYYSEVSRVFETPQDWTVHGADTLTLYHIRPTPGFEVSTSSGFTVRSAGSDIGGTSDQFHFVYRELVGDGSITAWVFSLSNTHSAAKAGVMIRETLDVGSPNAYVAVTPGSGLWFQWRATSNENTANPRTAGLKAPYWVRLTRTGDVFRAERSVDGKTWTQEGTDVTLVMNETVCIGMAVTSHDATRTTEAAFMDVSVTGTPRTSWQGLAIGMPTWANDPAMIGNGGSAPLYLMVEDKAGKTAAAPLIYTTTRAYWSQWMISLPHLSAAGADLTAVKKLTIGVGDRAKPAPGGAGLIYLDDIGFGHPAPPSDTGGTATRGARS